MYKGRDRRLSKAKCRTTIHWYAYRAGIFFYCCFASSIEYCLLSIDTLYILNASRDRLILYCCFFSISLSCISKPFGFVCFRQLTLLLLWFFFSVLIVLFSLNYYTDIARSVRIMSSCMVAVWSFWTIQLPPSGDLPQQNYIIIHYTIYIYSVLNKTTN